MSTDETTNPLTNSYMQFNQNIVESNVDSLDFLPPDNN